MSSSALLGEIYADLVSRLESAWRLKLEDISPVALHEPLLTGKEKEYVSMAIESGFISSVGPFVEKFAEALESFTGVSYAIPIVNGTSALQLALTISGVEVGDEVAVPTLSFIATANAVKFAGAHPVFLDSEPIELDSSLGVSANSLSELLTGYVQSERGPISKTSGRRLSAIVPMHALGRFAGISEIRAIADAWKLPIVEDAAEALGTFKDGLHSGAKNTSILSFNGNKTITTGGGGAILTQSSQVAEAARQLSTTAKIPHPWRFSHSTAGWNFRMPALNAAVGLAQMGSLNGILASKRKLADSYHEAFSGSEYFEFYSAPEMQEPNHWLNALKVRSEIQDLLPSLLDRATSNGLHCRPMWDLLHLQPPYSIGGAGNFPNAAEARARILCIPSSPALAVNL